jgi:hypothetical protein
MEEEEGVVVEEMNELKNVVGSVLDVISGNVEVEVLVGSVTEAEELLMIAIDHAVVLGPMLGDTDNVTVKVKLLEGGLVVVPLLLVLPSLDAGIVKILRVDPSGKSEGVAKPVMDMGGNVVPAGL